jgi:hypothetical protein
MPRVIRSAAVPTPPEAERPPAAASPSPVRQEVAWAVALALVAALAVAGVARSAGAARRVLEAPGGEARWIAVPDAGDALRAWVDLGLHGRRVLVLTGRWTSLPFSSPKAAGVNDPATPLLDRSFLDADNVFLVAARLGTARALTVVLTPPAFEARREAARSGKDVELHDEWLAQRFHGYERRFTLPAALPPSAEPVLLLVEPSFFAPGTPPDPVAWLRGRGVAFDLGTVALADPAATPEQRERALALARAHGASLMGGER